VATGEGVTLTERHAELIADLADDLGVEARALRALLRVEAAGEGLCESRPIVRLEVHHLWRAVPVTMRPAVDLRFRVRGPRPWEGHDWRPAIGGPWVPLHQPGQAGQRQEWAALMVARSIHEAAAIESTSWGCAQLLGRHWKALGYDSPVDFASAMGQESEQLCALSRFLEFVARALPALRSRDWAEVARLYNGPGQVPHYAAELAEAYAAG
jgi:hypothetical protein